MSGSILYKKFRFRKIDYKVYIKPITRKLTYTYGSFKDHLITMYARYHLVKPWTYAGNRRVYKINDAIVKIAINEFDLKQNIHEYQTLQKIKPKDKRYFPKILKASKDSKLLIVSYIRRSWRKDTTKQVKTIYSLCKKYDIGDIESKLIRDPYANWIINKNGDPVILDCGFPLSYGSK